MARHLIKGGLYLEQGRKLKALAIDKTWTITTGKPAVTDVKPLGRIPVPSQAVPSGAGTNNLAPIAVRHGAPSRAGCRRASDVRTTVAVNVGSLRTALAGQDPTTRRFLVIVRADDQTVVQIQR